MSGPDEILPETGRGTMRSMVEEQVPPDATWRGFTQPMVPLHRPADGPPPHTGEELRP